MHAPRICLCIAEDDLRSWVMDELLLMTWAASPTIVTTTSLAAVELSAMSVVIVGIDQLAAGDLEELRSRRWSAPVIGIGTERLRVEYALGPRLTSRELERAVCAALSPPREATNP